MWAKPRPSPPPEGTIGSAVPGIAMTDNGSGDRHGSSCVPDTGPIAANSVVLQARVYDMMPPLLMPVAYTRAASILTFLVTSAPAAALNATSSMCSRAGLPQQPPPLTFQARLTPSG